MGKNSIVRNKTSNSRIDFRTTEIMPSTEDTTGEIAPLQQEVPNELEQKAKETESTSCSEDVQATLEQTVTVTEITSSPEDMIDDTPLVPEIIPSTSEQKALLVIPRLLTPVVIGAPRKSGIVSTVSALSNSGRHRGSLFIILAAIVLFFVAISGSYLVLGANTNTGNPDAPFTIPQSSRTTATVHITSFHTAFKNTYTIAIVTGQPDIAQKQVAGARIISNSQSQSLQVNATGNVSTPARSATGTLVFSRVRRKSVTIPAGTAFLDKNNIALVLNTPVTLQAKGLAVSVSAYANPAGIIGNIPALDINGMFCYPNCATGTIIYIQNTAFAGGRDPQSYTVVQQSDINNAASQLENSLANTTRTAIQSKIGVSEQQVGPISCGLSSRNSNQQAGARVPAVTVGITETCRGETYSALAAQTLAANLLKRDVTTLPGSGNVTAGKVITQVLTHPEIIDTQGTLLMKIMASGTAFYQFPTSEVQDLAKLIAGKSLADAQGLLLNQIGVARATIIISDNSANKLPDDPSKISVVVFK